MRRQMSKIRLFTSLIGIALLLAACAPAATSTGQPAIETSRPPDSTVQATAVPSGLPVPSPLPLATSRGPNLEASDPTTVNLASGGLQLVEFFRFT